MIPPRYSELPLAAPLSRFVECVWFLESDAAVSSPPERVVPDGCPELVVQLADPCRAGRPGAPLRAQAPALLVGPLTSCLFVAPSGRLATMGVRFRPGGLAAFTRAPADELADRQIAPEEVFGPSARDLRGRLLEADGDAARAAVAAELLLSRLAERDPAPRPVERAVRRLVARRGPVSVGGLAAEFGITRRHLERSFRRETGMGPARLGRVIRFQSVFREIGRRRGAWADVAVACGYYDQSHLIRDFRDFAAATPGELFGREEPGAFGGAFVSRERLDRFFAG